MYICTTEDFFEILESDRKIIITKVTLLTVITTLFWCIFNQVKWADINHLDTFSSLNWDLRRLRLIMQAALQRLQRMQKLNFHDFLGRFFCVYYLVTMYVWLCLVHFNKKFSLTSIKDIRRRKSRHICIDPDSKKTAIWFDFLENSTFYQAKQTWNSVFYMSVEGMWPSSDHAVIM